MKQYFVYYNANYREHIRDCETREDAERFIARIGKEKVQFIIDRKGRKVKM